jgi:peptidoglycan hydrolase CwlO-like protein
MISNVKTFRTGFKEVENFENKLLRANQKLNEMSSNNNKLRERINQLRKEKNSMEDIYAKLKNEL